MIRKVSRILLKPTDTLIVKLSVGVLDQHGNESYYSVFESATSDYLTFNMSMNVILQYKPPGGGPWDINQLVHVTESNIFYWNRKLQSFYNKIQTPDLYTYYTSGKIEYNGDDSYRMSIPMMLNEFVELEPGLIYDKNGDALPGVFMRLNLKENQIELSFDQFESILYKFSQLNIGLESSQLITAYLLLKDRILDAKTNQSGTGRPAEKPRVNIFQSRSDLDDGTPEKDLVVDNRRVSTEKPTSLDQLSEIVIQ